LKGTSIFIYVFVMWILIIAGGGLLVSLIAPISIDGFGSMNQVIISILKAVIAILLVVVWIFVMSKIKNWIFQKHISN